MAEDVEVNADEGIIDKAEGSEQSEEKTGFLKSKLFKIIAGVIVLLLISGSAYFFLIVKEEPEQAASDTITKENSIEENAVNTKSDETENISTDIPTPKEDDVPDTNPPSVTPEPLSQETNNKLIESEKVTTALQEKNTRMQQQINDLKAQISQKDKLIQDQQNTTEITPIRNSDSVDYQQDYFDDSSMREPNRTPPPQPSWGEFDRINKK